jgi:hypothetical protein
VRWMDGAMGGLCRGAAWSWSAQGLFLYSRFWVSLLRRRGVVGSWWRQQLFCFFRFFCLLVPWQPLSAVGFFLAPQDVLLLSCG